MKNYLRASGYWLFSCIFLVQLQGFCTEAPSPGFQIIGELPEDYSLLRSLQKISNEERRLLSHEYYSILAQLSERRLRKKSNE